MDAKAIDPVIPEIGERTFTYAGSDLQSSGCYTTSIGALFVGVSGVMFVAFLWATQRDPQSIHGPIWIFLLFFSVFIAISFWVASVGYDNWRTAVNAKLVLDPEGFRWYDKHGKLSIQGKYDDILSAEETVVSQPARRYERLHHRLNVETVSGHFAIEDRLSSYESISRFFINRRPMQLGAGVFRYRSYAAFPISLFIFAVTIPLCTMVTRAYFNKETMSVNGVMQTTPYYVPIFAILVSAVFWAFAVYMLLNFFFEKIEIEGENLRYYNLAGRLQVDVPLKFVELDSFDQGESMLARGSYIYSVGTTQGTVQWSDRIERCSTLSTILKQASKNGIG